MNGDRCPLLGSDAEGRNTSVRTGEKHSHSDQHKPAQKNSDANFDDRIQWFLLRFHVRVNVLALTERNLWEPIHFTQEAIKKGSAGFFNVFCQTILPMTGKIGGNLDVLKWFPKQQKVGMLMEACRSNMKEG